MTASVTPGSSPEPGPRSVIGSESPPAAGPTPRRRAVRLGVRLVLVALVVAAVFWANLYAFQHDLVREATRGLGYPGVFLAAVISGFNLVVPIPVVAFFPFFMEVGLEPVPTVMVIALGMTTGDLVGYLLGRTARGVVRPREGGTIRKLESLRERHSRLPLVLMFIYAAVAPAPNELLVMPLAFLRYPLVGIFLAVLAGNLIFNGLVALGAIRLFELF